MRLRLFAPTLHCHKQSCLASEKCCSKSLRKKVGKGSGDGLVNSCRPPEKEVGKGFRDGLVNSCRPPEKGRQRLLPEVNFFYSICRDNFLLLKLNRHLCCVLSRCCQRYDAENTIAGARSRRRRLHQTHCLHVESKQRHAFKCDVKKRSKKVVASNKARTCNITKQDPLLSLEPHKQNVHAKAQKGRSLAAV